MSRIRCTLVVSCTNFSRHGWNKLMTRIGVEVAWNLAKVKKQIDIHIYMLLTLSKLESFL
jgi:hypothetical protein